MDKLINLVEEALILAKNGGSNQLIYKSAGALSSIEIRTEAGIIKIQVIDNNEG